MLSSTLSFVVFTVVLSRQSGTHWNARTIVQVQVFEAGRGIIELDEHIDSDLNTHNKTQRHIQGMTLEIEAGMERLVSKAPKSKAVLKVKVFIRAGSRNNRVLAARRIFAITELSSNTYWRKCPGGAACVRACKVGLSSTFRNTIDQCPTLKQSESPARRPTRIRTLNSARSCLAKSRSSMVLNTHYPNF